MSGARIRLWGVCPLLAVIFSTALAAVAGPTMVADLSQSLRVRSSDPREIYRVGQHVVFAASAAPFGRELRSLHLDTSRIELLLDANPGSGNSDIYFATEFAGRLFYWSGPLGRSVLYMTDGTIAGTRAIVDGSGGQIVLLQSPEPTATTGERLVVGGLDVATGRRGLWGVDAAGRAERLWRDEEDTIWYAEVFGLARSGSRVFFLESTVDGRTIVWVTDGSSAGTRRVQTLDLIPDSVTGATDDRYVFAGRAYDATGGRCLLFSTDGTEGNTVLLGEWAEQAEESYPLLLGANRERVYFETSIAGWRSRLWMSDGSVAGTRRVDWPVEAGLIGDYEHPAVWFGDEFIFWAGTGDYPANSTDYWSHDGSAAPPKRLRTGASGEHPWLPPLIPLGDRLLFVALDAAGEGEEIWAKRQGVSEAEQLSDLCPPLCIGFQWRTGAELGESILFNLGIQSSMLGSSWLIARSDGSVEGTRLLARSWEGEATILAGYPGFQAPVDGGYFVPAADWSSGMEPWFVDEISGGLRQLANLEPENGPASPSFLLASGEEIYFVAPGVEESYGPWRLDQVGQPEELPLPGCSGYDLFQPRGTVGGRVLFEGDAGCLASFEPATRTWEILTDGNWPSVATSTTLADDGEAFFLRADAELWRTTGTSNGTVRASAETFEGGMSIVAVTRSHAYLRNVWGRRSLVSVRIEDGTVERLMELGPIDMLEPTDEFLPSGSRLYFTSRTSRAGEALWVTTGSAAATTPLWTAAADERILDLYDFAGELYFVVAGELVALWRSDGTPAGTRRVAELGQNRADADDARSRGANVLGGRLYFAAATDKTGAELWRSDGTEVGTRLFELVPGAEGSDPRELTAVAGKLFFSAAGPGFGREIWTFDPVTRHASRIGDIADGGLSSVPEELSAVGTTLYFSADDGIHGRELWKLDAIAEPASCLPASGRLCLLDGRFEVEALWRDFRGRSGRGSGHFISENAGSFGFVDEGGAEVMVKLVDACAAGLPETWAYLAGVTNLETTVSVRDTRSGERYEWHNSLGQPFAPRSAALANPACAAAAGGPPLGLPEAESDHSLALLSGRFLVTAEWRTSSGAEGSAWPVPLDDRSGYFWFFDPAYPEVLVKMVDACGFDGFDNFWVFAGGLTDVAVHLTVTDTWTGQVVRHDSQQGDLFPTLLETGQLRVCAAAP